MMPTWGWVLTGVLSAYVLLQIVLLVRLGRSFLKELTKR